MTGISEVVGKLLSSGMLCRVVCYKFTDVSEVLATSIIRAPVIIEPERALKSLTNKQNGEVTQQQVSNEQIRFSSHNHSPWLGYK
jgi:hypothetical protein